MNDIDIILQLSDNASREPLKSRDLIKPCHVLHFEKLPLTELVSANGGLPLLPMIVHIH